MFILHHKGFKKRRGYLLKFTQKRGGPKDLKMISQFKKKVLVNCLLNYMSKGL